MTIMRINKPLTQQSLKRQRQDCWLLTRHAIRHPNAARCPSLTQGINARCWSTSPTHWYHPQRQPQKPHRISSWIWRQMHGSFHNSLWFRVRHCSLCHPFWPAWLQSA